MKKVVPINLPGPAKRVERKAPKEAKPSASTEKIGKSPLIVTPPKFDKTVSRFRALLPDLEGITERIIDGDLDHTQAIEVESKADDMVDWAPNVLVFCADKRFVGMKPYGKQAEILLLLFEEFCARCSDVSYVTNIPTQDTVEQVMAKVALLEFGKCPHCGFTKADGRATGVFHDPLELIAVIGQRAGKSATAALAIAYLIHINLRLTSPWKAYSLTPGQIIDFTIVATTVGQADKTLWATFKGLFTQSNWFKAYKAACDEEGKKHGVKETVKVLETFIWFEHKGVMIYFAANNPSGLRGTTRFGAAIDELGWFGEAEPGSQKVRANGPETYSALNNACMTLRQAAEKAKERNPASLLPFPILFNISSPRSMNDPIMTIYRERSADKRTIRRHWATWDVNPNYTKTSLARELATSNGVRDFGAQPPITDDPLIDKIHIITDAFNTPMATDDRYGRLLRPTAKGFIDDLEVPAGRYTTNFITAHIEDELFIPDSESLKALEVADPEAYKGLGPLTSLFRDLISRPAAVRPHIMGVDLGTKNNALAVVCGYLADDGSKFVTDFALEVKPTPTRSVSVADVFDKLIVKAVEKLNVVAVFYDTWQSIHQIQNLSQRFGSMGPLNSASERRHWLKTLRDKKQRPAFLADQYSLSLADANMLVSRLEQGDCLFPGLEVGVMELLVNRNLNPADFPYAHLALQMATVRARGARLLKPVGGDDDLFRAWSNAAVKALTDEVVIDLLSQDTRGQPMAPAAKVRDTFISVGVAGKGIRRTEIARSGAHSSIANASIVPVAVGRGKSGGLKGYK